MVELKKLYDYQKKCIKKLNKFLKGIVCLPTGTGKTLIQAQVIADDIIKHQHEFRLYVINAPRIMLSFQLMKDVYTYLMSHQIESMYMCVHSGGGVDKRDLEKIRIECTLGGIDYSKIESGTSPQLIRDSISSAKKLKLPLVIFSTYHSANRIELARFKKKDKEIEENSLSIISSETETEEMEESTVHDYLDVLRESGWRDFNDKTPEPEGETTYDSIDIVMNDEAHYLVQERFFPILTTLKSKRCYFFTATMIQPKGSKDMTSYEGRGMNNKNSYGELIYEMTPRQAINKGRMVRPRLHYLCKGSNTKYSVEDYETSIGIIIEQALKQHAVVLKEGQQPKILVSVKGLADIKRFLDTDECIKMIADGVTIYAVASNDSIGNNINKDNRFTRQEFLSRLKDDGSKDEKRLVVLHYDILAEGIDVSGFSGILPFRTLGKAKFMQTFGRAARLNESDRDDLKKGKIKATDWKNFRKPYAWVIVPDVIAENIDNKQYFRDIIKELRSYDFDPVEEIVITDDANGLDIYEGPEGLLILEKKSPKIGEYIREFVSDIESERLASLSDDDYFNEMNPPINVL